jgi:membrane protease YdiL (CAAX protease family)
MFTEPTAPAPTANTSTGWQSIFLRADGLRSGWRLAIFLLIFFLLANLGLLAVLHLGAALPSYSAVTPAALLAQEIPALLATLAAVLVMSRIESRRLDSYGLPLARAFGGNFWRGAVWGLVMIAGTILAIALAGAVSFGGIALHGWSLLGRASLWAVAFFSVGLWEEFFNRGYALATLADGIGFWPAASVISALFASTHLLNGGESWVGVPHIFLISMFFCLTLQRTGNLWFAIGLHAAWDFGETFIFSAPDSGTFATGTLLRSTFRGPLWLTGGSVGPEASVIAILVVILAMLLFVRLYPERP